MALAVPLSRTERFGPVWLSFGVRPQVRMRPHHAKMLRRWIEALIGVGILSAWIVAEIYFSLIARFIIGAICVLVAFYFGWRLERVNTPKRGLMRP